MEGTLWGAGRLCGSLLDGRCGGTRHKLAAFLSVSHLNKLIPLSQTLSVEVSTGSFRERGEVYLADCIVAVKKCIRDWKEILFAKKIVWKARPKGMP